MTLFICIILMVILTLMGINYYRYFIKNLFPFIFLILLSPIIIISLSLILFLFCLLYLTTLILDFLIILLFHSDKIPVIFKNSLRKVLIIFTAARNNFMLIINKSFRYFHIKNIFIIEIVTLCILYLINLKTTLHLHLVIKITIIYIILDFFIRTSIFINSKFNENSTNVGNIIIILIILIESLGLNLLATLTLQLEFLKITYTDFYIYFIVSLYPLLSFIFIVINLNKLKLNSLIINKALVFINSLIHLAYFYFIIGFTSAFFDLSNKFIYTGTFEKKPIPLYKFLTLEETSINIYFSKVNSELESLSTLIYKGFSFTTKQIDIKFVNSNAPINFVTTTDEIMYQLYAIGITTIFISIVLKEFSSSD